MPQQKNNFEATITPQSLHPQHSTIHIEIMCVCVCVLHLVRSVVLLFFDPQPNVCSEMYTHVHNVNALSELAAELLRRLALLTACPLLVTVCMADCADVSL